MGMDLKALFAAQEPEVDAFIRRRIGSRVDSADLTQETFVRIARIAKEQAVENPRGFLFTVAANLVRDHLRRRVRRDFLDAGPPSEDIACPAPSPEDHMCESEQQHILRKAIDQLPGKTRAIFLLYHAEELSYREIADRLEVSPRTVEYHLRQALLHCREFARRAGLI